MLRKLKIFTLVSFLSSTLITPVFAEGNSERGIGCNPYTYITVNTKNYKASFNYDYGYDDAVEWWQ